MNRELKTVSRLSRVFKDGGQARRGARCPSASGEGPLPTALGDPPPQAGREANRVSEIPKMKVKKVGEIRLLVTVFVHRSAWANSFTNP